MLHFFAMSYVVEINKIQWEQPEYYFSVKLYMVVKNNRNILKRIFQSRIPWNCFAFKPIEDHYRTIIYMLYLF